MCQLCLLGLAVIDDLSRCCFVKVPRPGSTVGIQFDGGADLCANFFGFHLNLTLPDNPAFEITGRTSEAYFGSAMANSQLGHMSPTAGAAPFSLHPLF